ncbi:hypothetical protein KCP74_15000 [Salmonella enterica subsp. enterica]|nr:hypothetical protein KCP74_15000 [Salmonella enterica subsp. enterica]
MTSPLPTPTTPFSAVISYNQMDGARITHSRVLAICRGRHWSECRDSRPLTIHSIVRNAPMRSPMAKSTGIASAGG